MPTFRPPLFTIVLGLSLWAAVLGWIVSPWLEMWGLFVLLVLTILTWEGWRK